MSTLRHKGLRFDAKLQQIRELFALKDSFKKLFSASEKSFSRKLFSCNEECNNYLNTHVAPKFERFSSLVSRFCLNCFSLVQILHECKQAVARIAIDTNTISTQEQTQGTNL